MLRGQAVINQKEVQKWRASDYQVLPSPEPDPVNEQIDESRHGAGQPSSIAPLPTTDTDNNDENSNHLIEVSIIPPPTHLLNQSFMLFNLIYQFIIIFF